MIRMFGRNMDVRILLQMAFGFCVGGFVASVIENVLLGMGADFRVSVLASTWVHCSIFYELMPHPHPPGGTE